MDAHELQKKMLELQSNNSFSGALRKVASGKSNLRPVLEKKPSVIRCRKCSSLVDANVRFCPKCGTRIE
jgi:Zn finger protein HypA/HybF involved in hydrogenase expression